MAGETIKQPLLENLRNSLFIRKNQCIFEKIMLSLKGESKNIEAYFGMLFFYATKLRNVTNTKWYLLHLEKKLNQMRIFFVSVLM